MAPYWVLDSPYSLLSVKIVLAAGNVTRTTPCTSAAALMIVRSVFEAIRPSRQLSPQVSPLGLIDRYRSLPAGPARCHPPSQDEAALRDGYHAGLARCHPPSQDEAAFRDGYHGTLT